jgi:hypothetical protein
MDDGDLSEQIARLEERIEALTETIERCRRIILASKLAIAAGAVLIVVMGLGLLSFNPTAFLAGITAVIGGIVVFGSNTSTAKQATAAQQQAEAQRTQLIGMIDLRVVDGTCH